ncbi:uncharacterized protein LOC127725792 isoform X2 [Mytilus californianus]|uniref:uncharacterized protein LOC127725792 isoform X2 n=1 Tax=Mytilus californianus TaxID=6549 RepID=UPI00224578A3|nr:uncharacterized protein LOC127725792 isoform X2 [Mytilus californianus]
MPVQHSFCYSFKQTTGFDAKSCKGRPCAVRMPLMDDMKAPLVAELDVSEVNRELKQFIEISINSTFNENIEEMIVNNLGVLKSLMLKEYSDEKNRTKHMYDTKIVNMIDSFKARQDYLETELKEYSSNLSISGEHFEQKLIDLVRDVEGKFDAMFLNMTSHYKLKISILSESLKKELIDFQENTDEWKNNITQTLLEHVIIEVANGKNTEQSSEYPLSSFPARNAVDGSLSSFSHTSSQTNPYWFVDLGTVYAVKRIEVFARIDCCGYYIHDMDITVGSTTNNMKLCTHYKGPASTKERIVLTCNKTVDGRFVKLSIFGEKSIMALAEVKVFAFV